MKTIKFIFPKMAMVLLGVFLLQVSAEYQYPSFHREPTGPMVRSEHFANAYCGQIQDGVDGPSLQTVQGKNSFMASDRYGNYYFSDMNTNQVWWRDSAGVTRVIAGTGEHGFRDGPAGQAQFYFWAGGYVTYNNIKCDDSGRIYIGDMGNNRLRMIYRKADGDWYVSTVSGGGTLTPMKGQWISALRAKWGSAPEFGVLPDGSAAYYAYWGGLYKVQINHELPESSKVTIIANSTDTFTNFKPTGAWDPFYQWKCGTIMTPDSVFIWSPMDPSNFLRYDEKTGIMDLYAGTQVHRGGVDGYRLDAGWHTHIWVASPSGKAIFSGSGDDLPIRRMWDDTVKTLGEDGQYRMITCAGMHCGYNASVLNVDFKGRLFYLYGYQSMFSNVIGRMTFENSDTTDIWESFSGTRVEKANAETTDPSSLFIFPNPFNPSTLVHYNLASLGKKDAPADLIIFNCNGQAIRHFQLENNEGDVIWNGENDAGRKVGAGHYLITLTAGNKRLVQRAIYAK